ncbi:MULTISPECIES: methyl-accepting chemotaxis protein [unclassified Bradyrhizobium]|uniref:methyl-accepting chemotaxis protein n=1 Tax=unclassified Bradyrhizobium TaxID=2631580 RepID=UPI002479D05E|nr:MULTISPECIES: methyl-accepting chemotaxis protein [unclassified Bradyrhizobium]WGR72085.1 methyl-accepting chemotaxis protein [Bradyrhizobium sp. ISRA426]WGR76919.1 methyl-accepting chemotaxis protein [Bradyrhizobium sp. ISRA430]WGR87324.1 methyl-accepting chemotaxis protein [Bradyrhizobium sp. ISRA432]
MAMFKKSVSTLLLVLMALLAVGALTSTAIQMAGAFGRYRDSLETGRLAAADKAIFQGVLSLRNNRGDAQSALLGDDDPRTKLGEAEKAEQAGYEAIAAALSTIEFAGRDDLASTLKQRWSDAAPQFQLFYDEAKRPRAERKIERTSAWYDAVTKVIDTANLASTAVSNRAWTNDPFIARMIQVRRLAWQVRDRYGIQCSSLRPNINTSKPLDETQKQTVAGWNGIVTAGWTGMGELLAAPDVTAELVNAAKDARAKTDGVLKQIGELTKNLDGSGRPALPAAEWNALCQSPFAQIVAVATKALDQSIARAETVQERALTNLIVQSFAFLLALAVTIAGVFVVRNRLVRPVRAILNAIARIGARDFATAVPQSKYPDEFGTMAAALESLRESAATAERLGQERESQQALQLARSGTVDAACRSFDDTVQAVIQSVAASAKELDVTATGMRSLVSESSSQTAAVSSAAEQATNNLETIAAATEELSASVGEISAQVQASAHEARQAVAQAEQTNATVEILDQTASRIGEVVKMINAIAGQTNLLALNATIEAARAGEAGRGFAVVAGEVKSLAAQTATATEEISRQVEEIQGATGQAVAAIRSIGGAISGIDEKMTAIAAAVEEQRAATTEISRNFQQAAQGTREVTDTIGSVASLNRETGNAGNVLFESVRKMSADADRLRVAVEGFLGAVKTA